MRGQLRQAIQAAGELALSHFRKVGMAQADKKGQADFVSYVDKLVQDEIICRLKQTFPDHAYIGEESPRVVTEGGANSSLKAHWIIDPIDGTTNFLRGLPAWAISICFCDEVDTPKMAAIYDPVHNELYEAERSAGAWLNGTRIRTSECTQLNEALWASALPFRYPEALPGVVNTFGAIQAKAQDMRRSGSAALDMAAIASGRIDAYWEPFIYPWDVAAGELLVREAGGHATDLFGQTSDLLNRRSTLAAATPELHKTFAPYCNNLSALFTKTLRAYDSSS